METDELVTTEPVVNVALVYNAFDTTKVVREELLYVEDKSLAEYIEGLPSTCEWKVGLNGVPVEESDYTEVAPKADDLISIVAVPRGGGGAKDILRLIAQVAITVVAMAVGFAIGGPLGAMAAAGIMMAGSFLVNAILPPTTPKMKDMETDGNSYGYDGAKNTAREGVALPVCYGEFQTGGNYVDVFTENVGDTQFLYGRVVLSDGEIDGITGEPEINETPISDYKDVEYGHTKGTLTEAVNPRFGKTKAHFSRQDRLDDTWTEYTTSGDVDAFEINFLFPRGLIEFDEEDGDKKSESVTVEVQYAPYGTSSWAATGTEVASTSGYTTFNAVTGSPTATAFQIRVQGVNTSGLSGATVQYNLQYRPVGGSTWVTYNTYTDVSGGTSTSSSWSTENDLLAAMMNQLADTHTYENVFPTRSIYLTLPSDEYEFRVTNVAGSSLLTYSGYQTAQAAGSVGSTSITYTETKAYAVRKTYKSPTLTHGRYHIRFRRIDLESTEARKVDELHCTDIAEVLHTNVGLRSVATGWFVAKMTDQLQGVPNITWKVKGVKVPIYNVNGTITSTVWSNNPADVALDMLISDRRGALKDKIQIDWPAFVEWREYCNEEELTFNGIFDTTTTLWDALIQVFRVGRAMPVRVGSQLSVAVDKPKQPVMLFGPGNIYQDTFEIGYLPLQDRAAEFEVSFYDKDDRNKKKTIRIADPTAAQAGQVPKTVAYELFGVDNFTQAQKEVWYQLYNNRLQRRVISFDAPVEAIGLTIGDVALIQHDMVEWGQAGRLAAAASTTQVTLDKEVTIESGTYALLVVHSKVQRFTCNISSIIGSTYSLTGISNVSHAEELLKRLETNTGKEAAILAFDYTGGSTATVTLDQTVTGTTATVWDVDVIEERIVSVGVGDHTVITVATPFSQVPAQYSNYMFGIQSTVKRPYKLNSISGSDIYQRSLTFTEYNELVWSPPETIIPPPSVQPPKHPEHVQGLILSVEPYRSGTTVNATLSWLSGHIKRYAGADIYISIDDSEYMFFQSVLNTNLVMLQLQTGTYIKLKVVAFNETSLRANINTAPQIIQTIVSAASTLANPQGLGWTLTEVEYMAKGYLSWSLPVSPTLPVSPYTRVQIKYVGQTEWLDKGTTSETTMELLDIPAGGHIARIRAENTTGAISNWVNLEFDIDIPVLVSPTFVTTGSAVDHDVNTDGSVNLSLEWLWSGSEDEISGFEVISYQGGSSSEYFLGSQPGQETVEIVAANKRIHWWYGVPADKHYTMYVRAFRPIHPSFSANGKLYSNAVKPSLGAENPYQPSSSVAFGGDVTGSVGGIPVEEILASIGASDATPPAIPSGLGLTSSLEPGADGDEWIKLTATWSPNADGDMLGYVLAVREGATGNFIEFTVGESATNFYWSVLPATQYGVKILAFDKYNNRSLYSSIVTHTTVSDTTAPSTPTSVLATGSFKNIYLTWNNPNNADLAYVEIYEKDTNVTPTHYANVSLGTDTSLIVTKQAKANTKGLFSREGPSGTRYYWIAAVDTSGNRSALSTVTSATPGTQIIEAEIADFALTIAKFGDALNPIERVAALPSTGNYYGRLVMLSTDNKVYRWVGAGTKSAPVTGTASWSSAADAGDLTTGTLNANRIAAGSISADKIAANSITASKMAIGDWVNLCQNGQFANTLSWTLGTGFSISQDAAVAYQGRSWVMKVAANAGSNRRSTNENKFPATAGESFNVKWFVRSTTTTLTGAVLVEIQWYDAANVLLSASNVGTFSTQNIVYAERTGNVTAPANTSYGIATVLANNTAGEVDIGEIYVARRNAGQLIVDGTITTSMISAGGIAADVITTGSMSAARIAAGTTMSGSVIVGSYTFDELADMAEIGGEDPATRINANVTLIQPGKVLISGATTLANWRNGTDATKIEGGSIAANTVTANKLNIGVRGVDIAGVSFQANSPSTNRVSWTTGTITYVDDAGTPQTVTITANNVLWSSGTLFLYWTQGGTTIQSTAATATAYSGNNIVLATYRGGVDLVANYGRTIIDGSHIVTDSIDANRIKAGTVLASTVLIGTVTAGQISTWAWDADATYIDGGNIYTNTITANKLSVTSLSAITATIGTLRTATTGARTEIKDNLITVYDSSNVMRVRMGIWTV